MTHAHAMREGCFHGEPTDWRDTRLWLAMAGRGRGGPGGYGGPGGHRHGHGGPRGRHRRRPRGDVRAAILVLLDEEARNGYWIMQEIEERSAGAWRPSPGSVYPVLSQLEDEGLVRTDESGERKLMALTDEGHAYVAERRDTLGTPWDTAAAGVSEEMVELRTLIWQVGAAVRQVVASGTGEQHKQARDVLAGTRRSLYRILAGDDPDES